MQSGSSGQEDPICDINVTPLVDVSLVLVIIFMAVSPFVMHAGIKASESRGGAAKGKTAAHENVNLELDEKGNIKINQRLVSREDLPVALEQAIAKSKNRLVYLTASKASLVGDVVELLDLSKQKGAKKLAIMHAEIPKVPVRQNAVEQKTSVLSGSKKIQTPKSIHNKTAAFSNKTKGLKKK